MTAHVKPVRVAAGAVRGLIADAMVKSGLPAGDAAKVAELMLEADLVGADAHGVFRLPQYVMRLKIGGLNPRPNIKVERTAPATALVDGDNGMGHLVVSRAAETAIDPQPTYRVYPGYYPTYYDGIDGTAPAAPAPDYTSAGISDGWNEPAVVRPHGPPLSGRWVRRGRKIILLGV